MNVESIANHTEANIKRVFNKFKDNPAVFLSKSDVICYLYYHLIRDPFLHHDPTVKNLTANISRSKTFLVHAGLNVSIEGENKQVALSVGETKRETDLPSWDFPIGIEIEHNLEFTSTGMLTLEEGVKKVATYKRGYVLCLNWDPPMAENGLKAIEQFVSKFKNVKFYYIDLSSKPVKTNF